MMFSYYFIVAYISFIIDEIKLLNMFSDHLYFFLLMMISSCSQPLSVGTCAFVFHTIDYFYTAKLLPCILQKRAYFNLFLTV